MKEEDIKKLVRETVRNELKGGLFTARKLTDTPTDDLAVTNRKYVTLNGTLASRPASIAAITGQRYFATDTNIPMTFDGTTWRDGVGSIVASN